MFTVAVGQLNLREERLLGVSLRLGSQGAVTPLSRSVWPEAQRQL